MLMLNSWQMPDVWDWIALGVTVAVAIAVLALVFRSLKRWKLPPPSDEIGRQAEARLWSKKDR